MMEAKATVIKGGSYGLSPANTERIREAQAEISFKAGYEERDKWLSPNEAKRLEEALLAGRREVVKWVNLEMFGNSDGYIFDEDSTFSTSVFHRALQAQKKVWFNDRSIKEKVA